MNPKIYLISFLLFLSHFAVFAQVQDSIYSRFYVEQTAKVSAEFETFMREKFSTLSKNISGIVVVQFVINKDGSLSDIKILKGVREEFDAKLLDWIQKAPHWIPARHFGKPVRTKIPLTLYLGSGNKDKHTFPPPMRTKKTRSENEIRSQAEEMPFFSGGFKAFYQYIDENLQYPPRAKKLGIEGKVFVQFIVEKDNSLSDIKVVKGIGAGCDEEALRLVRESSPKWNAGKNDGKSVRVKIIVPVNFNLE